MSSKADFYLGRALNAKWVGSITFGGYTPSENGRTLIINLCNANTEEKFLQAVQALIALPTNEGHLPANGWPWDYPDSTGSDYSYFFSYNSVKCACYGSVLFDPFKDNKWEEGKFLTLPRMPVKIKIEPPSIPVNEILELVKHRKRKK